MTRLLALLAAMFSATLTPTPVAPPVAPDLTEALEVTGIAQVHALGFSGRGVSILVIDNWRMGHGQRVTQVLRAAAPGAGFLRLDKATMGTQESFDYALESSGSFHIINMSFGITAGLANHILFSEPCPFDTFGYEDSLAALAAAGITMVASAGNNAKPDEMVTPACHPDVISVGASYDETLLVPDPNCPQTLVQVDHLACFTNEAPFLDLVAPGRDIMLDEKNFDGTSASAPLVSGTVALMLEANPLLSPAQIRNILRESGAVAVSARTNRTYPRLDALKAVEAALALKETLKTGQPPSIVSATVPEVLAIHTPTTWPLAFADPDGNVVFYEVEQRDTNDDWHLVSRRQTELRGVTEGVIEVVSSCSGFGKIAERVTLIDMAGNRSPAWGYDYECVSAARFAGDDLSVAEALDHNINNVMDDPEIREAIRLWVAGATVSDTGRSIDDALMLKLIEMWTKGTRIDQPEGPDSS